MSWDWSPEPHRVKEFQLQNSQRDGLNDRESVFMDLASIYAAPNNFSDSNLPGEGDSGLFIR